MWKELGRVPYGEVRTYGDIAAAIGRPTAVRAVGAANGANPIPLLLPCHRIIGANRKLTGFRGGLELKRRLLDLERIEGVTDGGMSGFILKSGGLGDRVQALSCACFAFSDYRSERLWNNENK